MKNYASGEPHFIGAFNNTDKVREQADDLLSRLAEEGMIVSHSVDRATTLHASRNMWGRVLDWVRWKTPLKRWLVKPYWVEVGLSDILTELWETERFPAPPMEDQIDREWFWAVVREVEGIKVWEKRWPNDPYTSVSVDMTIVPSKPLDFIKMEFTIGEDDEPSEDSGDGGG